MRRVIFGIVFIVLFVIACSNSRQQEITAIPGVKLFMAMNDNVTYSETAFSGADAKAITDLVKSECPQGVGDSFLRVTLDAKATSLVLYTSPDGKNITCSVLKPKEQRPIVQKNASDAPTPDVALLVNGQPITLTQLRAAIKSLPTSVPRDQNAVAQAANQLINDELLRQEAAKISVNDSEQAQTRASILAQANLTEDQLGTVLARQNITMEQFDARVVAQAQLQKLLKERLLSDDINVSEDQAKEYYMTNPDQFLQTEQAVMRHIFISNQNRTADQMRARAQEVYDKLNTTDFCQLVKTYSDDAQSQQNCGVYVVARGVIDPNLELAAFSTKQNQTSIVNTADGLHFVQTLQVTPAQVIPYPQVSATLQDTLRNAQLQQRLNLYLATLRSSADIVSFLG